VSKVLVLGSTGMLGHVMTKVLRDEGLDVVSASRRGNVPKSKNIEIQFDVSNLRELEAFIEREKFTHLINCIGMIKQLIDENSTTSRSNAVQVNTDFPINLNLFAEYFDFQLIQIGTDCVFSGENGSYSETSDHSPVDLYGRTKSMGEVAGDKSLILRTSIIGPEINSRNSLLEWFLSTPQNSKVNGFTNHRWNGLTTLHFSKLVFGIIKSENFARGLYHIIPQDRCSKYELLQTFKESFAREDIFIEPVEAAQFIDRTLITNHAEFNSLIWRNCGYNKVPTISEMVIELSEWILRAREKSRHAK
jgi:dTDP-4-dehydrorhamnose reductase